MTRTRRCSYSVALVSFFIVFISLLSLSYLFSPRGSHVGEAGSLTPNPDLLMLYFVCVSWLPSLSISFPFVFSLRLFFLFFLVLPPSVFHQMSEEEASQLAKKMIDAEFDFNDFLKQAQMMKGMGSLGGVANMIPGMAGKLSPQQLNQAEVPPPLPTNVGRTGCIMRTYLAAISYKSNRNRMVQLCGRFRGDSFFGTLECTS